MYILSILKTKIYRIKSLSLFIAVPIEDLKEAIFNNIAFGQSMVTLTPIILLSFLSVSVCNLRLVTKRLVTFLYPKIVTQSYY